MRPDRNTAQNLAVLVKRYLEDLQALPGIK